MAVDFFLQISGPDIKGKSLADGFEDAIDILSWSWGCQNLGTAALGSGSGGGKVDVNDLTLSKYLDKATTALILACCKGTHYDKAVLTCRKAGDTPLDYWVMTMNQVLVTHYSVGAGGDERLSENITLNFAKFEIVYKTQDKKGKQTAGGNMSYNITKVK